LSKRQICDSFLPSWHIECCSYHILRNFNRRPTCRPTFWGIDQKSPISNHRKDQNCLSNAVKNGYCSMSCDNLYPSNCKTIFLKINAILKFDPTPWSYQNLFKWLPNKDNSGMVYNIFKSSNYEKLCVREDFKMLSALDWHRNRLHCHVFWMPAPKFESLHTFSTTFLILKPNNNQLIVNVITIRNWFFLKCIWNGRFSDSISAFFKNPSSALKSQSTFELFSS